MWWLVVVLALSACAPMPPAIPGGARAELENNDGHLLVSVHIDGQPQVLVVDTGASITSLTNVAATRLGIAATGATTVNGITVRTGTVRALAIAGAAHADVRVAIVDMAATRRLHANVDGILGLDVLARHDIVVDRARGTLAIHPQGALATIPITATMERVPLAHASHGLIVIDVVIEDVAIPAVLDLGAPISYLNVAAGTALGRRRYVSRGFGVEIGGTRVHVPQTIVLDLPIFHRLGLAGRPAMLLGADAFDDRLLAIGYRDRVAFVSR